MTCTCDMPGWRTYGCPVHWPKDGGAFDKIGAQFDHFGATVIAPNIPLGESPAAAIVRLIAERDEARAEVERLRREK